MQLTIQHNVGRELTLPINYQHILQSIIFRHLQQVPEYSAFLHNKGFGMEKRKFKLFTFGPIDGNYRIRGREITFLDTVSWEVRSAEPYFLKLLQESVRMNGLTYGFQEYAEVETTLEDKAVETDAVKIRMLSPICVYATDRESGKTEYFSPELEEFAVRVNDSFRRKYRAYSGVEADSDIELLPLQIDARDKCVTKYKGFYITAWKGRYVLRGERKYLDFLYQTGLGSKNSQGFGMFELE